MSEIMDAVRFLLHDTWHFLMHTFIPNTHIAYGVMLVGLALIPIGFKFLSLAVGHNVGEIGGIPNVGFGEPKSTSLVVSDKRKNDVR